ncbi:MAG: hypothetical protein ABJN36_09700 [Cyclobacteriaceae bacterium]
MALFALWERVFAGTGLGKAGRSGVRWAQPSTPVVEASVTMRWGNESTLWGTESVLSGK